MEQNDTKILNTIPIKNLLAKTSIDDTNIFVIEDDTTTYKITAHDLVIFIKETVKDTFLELTEIGRANGVAPLDGNATLPSAHLPFGEVLGTVYEGSCGKSLETKLEHHLLDSSNPHHTTSEQLGLDSVENKSSEDIRAEITAQNVIAALGYSPEIDGAYENAVAYVEKKIAELINSAPEALDTLKEVADAFAENKDIIDTLSALIGTKANQSELDSHLGNATIHMTSADKAGLATALAHASFSHARTDATKTEVSSINGSVIINGIETTVYAHPLSGITPGTYRQIQVDSSGHIIGGNNATLPVTQGGTGATTPQQALANIGITATSDELNRMDGIAATTAELNRLKGVSSDIQTQLNSKADKNHGSHLPTTTTETNGKFLVSNGSSPEWKNLSPDDISNALGYIPGTGSNILTAVKGDAETEYKTGNVNITPECIGLGKVNNTKDSEKVVLSATKLATEIKIGNADFNGTKSISLDDLGASANTHVHNYAGSTNPGGAASTALACTGNSATATKATQDSQGQVINTTYIKNLSINGTTLTCTKGDNTTETFPIQDTWRGIQNNLTSLSSTDSLAAAQGKILYDKIIRLDDKGKAIRLLQAAYHDSLTDVSLTTSLQTFSTILFSLVMLPPNNVVISSITVPTSSFGKYAIRIPYPYDLSKEAVISRINDNHIKFQNTTICYLEIYGIV